MAWVYILRGSNGRHYIGSTTDLERRLAEHQRGHTHTTKRLGDSLERVASAEFPSLAEARAFERTLKARKSPAVALHLLKSKAVAQR
jgi:putative endonuclease